MEADRREEEALTLYRASPFSVTSTTCTLAFIPSWTFTPFGIVIFGRQNMPAPV